MCFTFTESVYTAKHNLTSACDDKCIYIPANHLFFHHLRDSQHYHHPEYEGIHQHRTLVAAGLHCHHGWQPNEETQHRYINHHNVLDSAMQLYQSCWWLDLETWWNKLYNLRSIRLGQSSLKSKFLHHACLPIHTVTEIQQRKSKCMNYIITHSKVLNQHCYWVTSALLNSHSAWTQNMKVIILTKVCLEICFLICCPYPQDTEQAIGRQ